MHLPLPTSALIVKRHAVVHHMRKKFSVKFRPECISLLGGHVGIVVHLLLESVNYCTVWYKGKRGSNVLEFEQIGIFAEKAFHPRISEKLHAHRMHFTCLHCSFDERRFGLEGFLCGKRMSELMGKHCNVAHCAVEIGEYEWSFEIIESHAVSSAPLSRPRKIIKSLVSFHTPE